MCKVAHCNFQTRTVKPAENSISASLAQATTLVVMNGKPHLAISQTGGNLTIMWSTNADPGFILQSTTSLTPPVVWQDVTRGVQVIGDRNSVAIPLSNDTACFRLQE